MQYFNKDVTLPITHVETSLGVRFDSPLLFTPQINIILRCSYRFISEIFKIRKFLTVNDIRSFVQAVIVSRIDNCNSILYGIQECELNRLQMLQNSSARLIYGRRKCDHVSDLFLDLHWLPVKQRIIFKTLLFVLKIFLGMSPEYLSDCIKITDSDNRILFVSRFNTSYGSRAFSNSAPRLWNALPPFLRKSETVSYFKAHLKHHLFSHFNEFSHEVNKYKKYL